MHPISKSLSLGCVAVVLLFATPGRAEELSAPRVIETLDSLITNLSVELTTRLSTNVVRGSYTTAWRQFEDLAIEALKEVLPKHVPELGPTNFDAGIAGREKNRLADFALRCGPNTIEISIKAARRDGNPENDLGTFRDHERRKQLFAAAFTVMVRYQEDAGVLRAERVFFDRTWRCVGKSTLVDGVKYRKKDGNMRPKPWAMFDSGTSPWQSELDFEAAVQRAEQFRARELVAEYLGELSEADQRLLHEHLHKKFAAPINPVPEVVPPQ